MTDNDKVLIALTTCSSAEVAEPIVQALVRERLAACINQLPGVSSTYIWKDEVHTDAEVMLVIKTTESRFEDLKTRLKALHPYELPELVAIPVCAGDKTYLDWVSHNVKSGS